MNQRRRSLRSNVGGVRNELDSAFKFTKNYPMTRSKAKLLSSSKASPASAAHVVVRRKTKTKRLQASKLKRPEKKKRERGASRSDQVGLLDRSYRGSKRPLSAVRGAESIKRKKLGSTGATSTPALPSTSTESPARGGVSARSTTASSSSLDRVAAATTAPAASTMNLRSGADSHASAASAAAGLISSVPITYPSTRVLVQSTQMQTSATRRLFSSSAGSQPISVRCLDIGELKHQLKKATNKFNKACHQLVLLDQHMNDLQHSYSSSLENDRKTFKIVYRMQLATLEGTHNAYIEYIERQVERIKRLKRILFNNNTSSGSSASSTANAAAAAATAANASAAGTSSPAGTSSSNNTTITNNNNSTNNSNPTNETSAASSGATAAEPMVNIPIIVSLDRPGQGAQPAGADYLVSVTSDEEDTDDDEDDDDDLFETGGGGGHVFEATTVNSNII